MKGKKSAKREMLEALKKEMNSGDDVGMADKLKDLKKVTVASDSKEGLEKGLSKAQEILKKRSELLGLDEDEDEKEDKEESEEKMEMLKQMMDEE